MPNFREHSWPIAQVLAVAMTGAAYLLSVSLGGADRGEFVAVVLSGTIGGLVGGFSLDTSLPALKLRPDRIGLATVAFVAAMAGALVSAAISALTDSGSYLLAGIGAGSISAATALVGASLSGGNHYVAVVVRLSIGATFLVLAILLVVQAAGVYWWIVAWACAQLVGVLTGLVVVVVRPYRGERRCLRSITASERGRVAAVFVGVLALVGVYRFDQVFLSLWGSSRELGVYALCAQMVESAASPSIYLGQRTLALAGERRPSAIRRSWLSAQYAAILYCIAFAILVAAIYLRAVDGFAGFAIVAALLFPASISMSAMRPMSAYWVTTGGELGASRLSILVFAVALPIYAFAAKTAGMFGVAVATSLIYCAYLLITSWLSSGDSRIQGA